MSIGYRNRGPDAAPADPAKAAEPLVLGTGTTSGVEGFPTGRVARAAPAHAVVPVHAATQAPDEHEPDPSCPAGAAAAPLAVVARRA
ncbi:MULTISPECIES: hypothetical protein [unclassified Streptomyces]|uniref:hypothetical protein n=1 Tax=unclassified Streptomyces TaxID=2593676 RepID=UPI0033FF8EED